MHECARRRGRRQLAVVESHLRLVVDIDAIVAIPGQARAHTVAIGIDAAIAVDGGHFGPAIAVVQIEATEEAACSRFLQQGIHATLHFVAIHIVACHAAGACRIVAFSGAFKAHPATGVGIRA
ncbi:hypothetical protein D3C81_1202620 [compost metagenome]